MTRLKNSDICSISSSLSQYEHHLKLATGRSLLGIACHAFKIDKVAFIQKTEAFSFHVIPVTAGQGVIPDFAETVCAVLKYSGVNAQAAKASDTSGLALAFENKVDAVMMADDNRFVGINLHTRKVVDNASATGTVFAAALDLMARGTENKPVLVMGCGPVGTAGAKFFVRMGARVALYDTEPGTADSIKKKLSKEFSNAQIDVVKDLSTSVSQYPYILEATPSEGTLPDEVVKGSLMVSAPGVPAGISKNGFKIMKNRLVHDKLELGVTAMAVDLVLSQGE